MRLMRMKMAATMDDKILAISLLINNNLNKIITSTSESSDSENEDEELFTSNLEMEILYTQYYLLMKHVERLQLRIT